MPKLGKKYKKPKKIAPTGNELQFDYAPDTVLSHNTKGKRKNKTTASEDDTPRAFKRLMNRNDKAQTQNTDEARQLKEQKKQERAPKIQIKRGETMSEFSRRVNDAMPLEMAKGVNSNKAMRTSNRQKAKAENLRKEYKQQLNKRRGRTEDDDGADLNPENWSKKRDTSPDPFAHLQASKPKFGEVADAPPELPKIKMPSSVPKSAGSMARREILENERQSVIDTYRALKAKREQAN